MDALRFKGKGKGKSKDLKEKGKANKEKGTHSKSPDPRKWSVITAVRRVIRSCLRRKADLENAKAEGRPAVPPQAVHAVHEVGCSSSSAGDEVRSAGGSAGISVIRTAPGEVACIWVLSAASMRNKHYPKGIMLDSGAAVNVYPVDYFTECGIQSGRCFELQAADGSRVEHHGSRDLFYMVGGEVMKVRFEVTSLKAPILSLAALEDAGWRLGHQGDLLVLRRADLSLQVDRSTGSSAWRGWAGPWNASRCDGRTCCSRNNTSSRGRRRCRRNRPSRKDGRMSSHIFLLARGARPA